MDLNYAVVDVFAERALEGNALAIFSDGRGLTTEQMQAIAREMNLSETTFILPDESADEAAEGVRVRIFTTTEELPFAGHPTLGTASWLHWHHPRLRGAETVTLKLNAGAVPVRFEPVRGGPGVFATMRQADATFGATHEAAEVARVLGVPVQSLDASLPVQTVSTGMPFVVVPFVSQAALESLAIPQSLAQPWLAAVGVRFFFCVAPARKPASLAGPGADFHNRMQFYGSEDPATGSASGCAIAWLVRHGVVESGRDTVFEQGVEMGRPSRIHVRATLTKGRVHDVFVGGRTIPVASGTFSLAGSPAFTQS